MSLLWDIPLFGVMMADEKLKPVKMCEPARKIIREWPVDARQELGAVLIRLQRGEVVGMPDVRAMPSIEKGVFEIRLKNSVGAYRVFYISIHSTGIIIFHAFVKKSQQTPQKEIETGRSRLKSFLREL
jgi:phage-related protein